MNSMPDSAHVEDPTPADVAVEVTTPAGVGATEADITIARRALLEITSAQSIGEPAGSTDEGDGVITVYFDTLLSGYPGWRWTVSIAHVDGEEPSVLETELTPGDTALLSPAWIPWVDRLADYRAAQDAAGTLDSDDIDEDDSDEDDDLADSDVDDLDEDDDEAGDDDDADDPDTDLDDDDDDDDDDDLGSDILHSGDVDGVDIDAIDEDADDADAIDEDAEDAEDDAAAYDDGEETTYEEDDPDELEVTSSDLGIDEADDADDQAGDAAPEKPATT